MSYANMFREDVTEIPTIIMTVKVNIKQSILKNAGLGLFTLQDIPKNTFITFELNQENTDVINVDVNKVFGMYEEYSNTFCGKRSINYFMNDSGFNYDEPLRVYTPKKLQKINLKAIALNHNLVCYETLCDIKNGDELYRMYGRSYWSQFEYDIFVEETGKYSVENVDLILKSSNEISIKDFSDNDLYYAFKKLIIQHEITKAKLVYENIRDKSIILRINNFHAMYYIFGQYSKHFEETINFLVEKIPNIDDSIRYNFDQIFVDICAPAIGDHEKINWLLNRYPVYLENKYYKMYDKYKNSSVVNKYHDMFYSDKRAKEFHGDI